MRSMTSCKQAVLLAGHPRQDQSTSSDLEEQVQSTVDFESLEELEGGVAMRRASVFFVLGLRGDASRLLKRKPPCQDLRPAAAKISEEAKAEIQGRARRPRDKAPDSIKIRAVSLT